MKNSKFEVIVNNNGITQSHVVSGAGGMAETVKYLSSKIPGMTNVLVRTVNPRSTRKFLIGLNMTCDMAENCQQWEEEITAESYSEAHEAAVHDFPMADVCYVTEPRSKRKVTEFYVTNLNAA